MEGSPGASRAFVAVVNAAGRVHSTGPLGEILLASSTLFFLHPGRNCPRRSGVLKARACSYILLNGRVSVFNMLE